MYKYYEDYLNELIKNNKYRSLGFSNKSQNVLNFSTNDYLNLSVDKDVIEAGILSSKKYGMGATGSRLLSGNYELFEEFENIIATSKKTQSSLIFNSGFQANISALSAILDHKILHSKPLVFFDKLNHASLYQAVFLSKAELVRYNHNDIMQLESFLKKYQSDKRPKFIVTETLFGMDGDIAHIEQIVDLSRKFNIFLYLDEAHATGVFGKCGYGISTTVDLTDIHCIVMGTFSKAIGVSGGYIACDRVIKNFLVNRSSGFIYSTAMSPAVAGAALTSWKKIKFLDKERDLLQNLSKKLREDLEKKGFNIGLSNTHIIPIILNEEIKCLKIQDKLFSEKIKVSCIRPPTVPPNSSRLRIAINSSHTMKDLKKLLNVLNNSIK